MKGSLKSRWFNDYFVGRVLLFTSLPWKFGRFNVEHLNIIAWLVVKILHTLVLQSSSSNWLANNSRIIYKTTCVVGIVSASKISFVYLLVSGFHLVMSRTLDSIIHKLGWPRLLDYFLRPVLSQDVVFHLNWLFHRFICSNARSNFTIWALRAAVRRSKCFVNFIVNVIANVKLLVPV